jgi:hypothetical protein
MGMWMGGSGMVWVLEERREGGREMKQQFYAF